MNIQFLGHSCFLVEAGGYRVIIDPFLTSSPVAKVKAADIKVDAVLLSHGHFDHIEDAQSIALANDCEIVANYEISMYYASQVVKIAPMQAGGTRVFEWGKLKLTNAIHGSGLEPGDGTILHGGNPNGIVLTMGGKTFYHAGDTALFGDMKLIGEMHTIDVAALPIGDVFTMGPEEAGIAATWIGAGHYIPMHYNTFEPIKQDGKAWVDALSVKGIRGTALAPNESLEV
ncbi:metal-dependent hydrolase [Paenibacillus sp. N1-5-1-14]|uniref:metal-dependent hydrolase n=1 Tax=Paenibacillus radicibacter TaxID=2972488 RepID=UPI002158A99F|nr:metal-dependent hydrolase [Paenibacillus radicibacter]MCR8641582.1 metal-dependent hydrolase [Paenibacillus radicibacter]